MVHPRVCGELNSTPSICAARTGSSPRVRGTRGAKSSPPTWRTVHPRVCGELVWVDALRAEPDGSSPRVRGTLQVVQFAHVPPHGSSPRVRGTRDFPVAQGRRRRFIPACAGNSASGVRWARPSAVHPRVCGELAFAAVFMAAIDGSSPRVRGTPQPARRPQPNERFIPACAGNSLLISD